MRIRELITEWPFDMESDYRSPVNIENTTSLACLKRERVELGTLKLMDVDYYFWQTADAKMASVSTPVIENGTERHLQICNINFDLVAKIPNLQNPLQVSMVYTHPNYRTRGIAWMLYLVLARWGYSIISDYTQYNGGKAIWKKLASMSDMKKFAVRIWSDKTNDWVRDETNTVIKYDSENVSDDEIWDSVFGSSEKTTLFVLQSK